MQYHFVPRIEYNKRALKFHQFKNVLGLARTGLIFTGLQEGAQLGGGGWPHLAKQSRVFHTRCRHAGFRWGGAVRRELTRGSGACGAGAVWESGSVFVVFSPYLYRCCSCFPLCAVLLNCPYPDPPVSACFFSFSSTRRRGEGRPRGAFVAGSSRNQNTTLSL